jgi:hypothetical protein
MSEKATTYRDVNVHLHDVPLWGVAALFDRIHKELGKPNVGDISASLHIEYSGLNDVEYQRLLALQDELWLFARMDVAKEERTTKE